MIGLWKWGSALARLEAQAAAGAAEQADLRERLDALANDVAALAARLDADAGERARRDGRVEELASTQADAGDRIARAEERIGDREREADALRSHLGDELGRLGEVIARDEAGGRREARVNQLAADLARVERQGAIDLARLGETSRALAQALLLRRGGAAPLDSGDAVPPPSQD